MDGMSLLREAGAAALLLFNGVLDWRKREISLGSLLVFGAAGIGWNLLSRGQSPASAAGGAAVGLVFLGLGVVTRGMVGLGDGLLLGVLGLYLGFWDTFRLLCVGTCLAGLLSAAGILTGKRKWEDTIPFVPFLGLAFLLRFV